MPFKSQYSYWDFRRAVTSVSRYVHSEEIKAFLDAVLRTGAEHQDRVPEGGYLWRAQPGFDYEGEIYEGDEVVGYQIRALPPEMLKPLPEFALEGRANPKGIPYLYLATHPETALAEVGRWSGPELSLGRFKVRRELKLINFTLAERPRTIYAGGEPPDELIGQYVRADIDAAFSKPVARSDAAVEYVPTQIIAEVFKNSGYDGLAYQSSLGSCHEGHNVVLFKLDVADLVQCAPHRIQEIKFKTTQVDNGYALRA